MTRRRLLRRAVASASALAETAPYIAPAFSSGASKHLHVILPCSSNTVILQSAVRGSGLDWKPYQGLQPEEILKP